jgi:hypothetical protein
LRAGCRRHGLHLRGHLLRHGSFDGRKVELTDPSAHLVMGLCEQLQQPGADAVWRAVDGKIRGTRQAGNHVGHNVSVSGCGKAHQISKGLALLTRLHCPVASMGYPHFLEDDMFGNILTCPYVAHEVAHAHNFSTQMRFFGSFHDSGSIMLQNCNAVPERKYGRALFELYLIRPLLAVLTTLTLLWHKTVVVTNKLMINSNPALTILAGIHWYKMWWVDLM